MLPTVVVKESEASGSGTAPANSVELLAPEDLAVAHERSIHSVLEGHAGISTAQGGGQGQLGAIYLRGVGGQGLITLDGLPFPDSVPGIINLDTLLPDGLGAVEVRRGLGPASQAFPGLGGNIALRSRDAVKTGAGISVESGTFASLRETLRADVAGEEGRLAVTVNRSDAFDGAFEAQQARGNTERDQFHATQALMRAGLNLAADLEWEGSMFYRQSRNGWDDLGFAQDGTFLIRDKPNVFFREQSWMAQNTLKARLTPHWDSRLQVGYTRIDNQGEVLSIPVGYASDQYLARWENTQRLWSSGDKDAVHLIWGAEGRHERGETAQSALVTAFSQERNMAAGFLDLRFAYGDFSGDLGVRPQTYDRFDDHTLFHAGTAWQVLPTLKLRANGGNGFRIPSYGELVFPLVGSRTLRPERSASGDVGVEWQPAAGLKLSLTGFYGRYHDLIVYQWHSAPTLRFPCLAHCSANVPDATIAGAESEAEWRVNDQLRTGVAYTHTDSRNLDGGTDLPFRPRHTGRLWGEWRLPQLPVTLWAEGIYRGHFWNDAEHIIRGGDSVRVNVHAKYEVSPSLELYVRGENLNNDRTPQHVFFDYPGTAVYGGVTVKLF